MLTTNELISWVNKCECREDEEVRRALFEIVERRERAARGESDAAEDDSEELAA